MVKGLLFDWIHVGSYQVAVHQCHQGTVLILSHAAQSSLSWVYAAFLVTEGASYIDINLMPELCRPYAAFIHVITILKDCNHYTHHGI
ncbi:Uncharacterised protein [uncultured archaeon]|nr:Uncharacterised protein [uncultured archaeon]